MKTLLCMWPQSVHGQVPADATVTSSVCRWPPACGLLHLSLLGPLQGRVPHSPSMYASGTQTPTSAVLYHSHRHILLSTKEIRTGARRETVEPRLPRRIPTGGDTMVAVETNAFSLRILLGSHSFETVGKILEYAFTALLIYCARASFCPVNMPRSVEARFLRKDEPARVLSMRSRSQTQANVHLLHPELDAKC